MSYFVYVVLFRDLAINLTKRLKLNKSTRYKSAATALQLRVYFTKNTTLIIIVIIIMKK